MFLRNQSECELLTSTVSPPRRKIWAPSRKAPTSTVPSEMRVVTTSRRPQGLALGAAYGLDVVVDDSLVQLPELYLEAGDHAHLVHISGTNFRKLMHDARHGRFS